MTSEDRSLYEKLNECPGFFERIKLILEDKTAPESLKDALIEDLDISHFKFTPVMKQYLRDHLSPKMLEKFNIQTQAQQNSTIQLIGPSQSVKKASAPTPGLGLLVPRISPDEFPLSFSPKDFPNQTHPEIKLGIQGFQNLKSAAHRYHRFPQASQLLTRRVQGFQGFTGGIQQSRARQANTLRIEDSLRNIRTGRTAPGGAN